MIAEILSRLVIANLAATAAIAMVLALRKPARRLIGARAAYGLWLIVPAAMLAGFIPARTTTLPAPPPAISAPAPPAAGLAPMPVALAAAPSAPLSDPRPWLAALWAFGAAAFLLYLVAGQRRAVSAFALIGPDTQGRLRAASPEAGPAVLGVVRPRIVLPADFEARFAPAEQAMVLAHERAHLEAGDPWINAAVGLVRALNWFNPLIHVAANLARMDQELACDAAVVARHPGQRGAYAQAMLKTQLTFVTLPLGCAWPARSNPMLKERLQMLGAARPTRGQRLAGAAAVAALTAAAGLAAWAAEPPQVRIAQTPAAPVQAAVGAALGAAPQARTAVPPAAATVTPGTETVLAGPVSPDPRFPDPTDRRIMGYFTEEHGFDGHPGMTKDKLRNPQALHLATTLTLPDGRVFDRARDMLSFDPRDDFFMRDEFDSTIQVSVQDDGTLLLRSALRVGTGAPMLGDAQTFASGGAGTVRFADGSVLRVTADVREATAAEKARGERMSTYINIAPGGELRFNPGDPGAPKLMTSEQLQAQLAAGRAATEAAAAAAPK